MSWSVRRRMSGWAVYNHEDKFDSVHVLQRDAWERARTLAKKDRSSAYVVAKEGGIRLQAHYTRPNPR